MAPTEPATQEVTRAHWAGDVPPLKWMNFYIRVLAGLTTNPGLKLRVSVDLTDGDGISAQKIEGMRAALRELGLEDDVRSD